MHDQLDALLAELSVQYSVSDIDQHRTRTVFSGPLAEVAAALPSMAAAVFDVVDLNHHIGEYPRIGALDSCVFVALDRGISMDSALTSLAQVLAETHDVPCYVFGRSEEAHQAEADLRSGGFGGLMGKSLSPSFGPAEAHSRLGVTVFREADSFLTFNIRLQAEDDGAAVELARRLRQRRDEGDPRFQQCDAIGHALPSKNASQVEVTVNSPRLASPDPIVEWAIAEAAKLNSGFGGASLVGAIREIDLEHCERLKFSETQVIS